MGSGFTDKILTAVKAPSVPVLSPTLLTLALPFFSLILLSKKRVFDKNKKA